MLTGMGKDGAQAMLTLRQAGSYNLAQDEATSVVFGMPREAIALGASHETVPLSQIAARIVAAVRHQYTAMNSRHSGDAFFASPGNGNANARGGPGG